MATRGDEAVYVPTFETSRSSGSLSIDETHPIPRFDNHKFNISSMVSYRFYPFHELLQEQYKQMHAASLSDPDGFWGNVAREALCWFHPFSKVSEGGLEYANYAWFINGKLNACYNCVDRWADIRPGAIAIIYEGDSENDSRRLTFRDLKEAVCKVANVLKQIGVGKGDVVTIYMPNIPELCFTVLACARIGAIHSVVFGGFSASSLAERITSASCKFVVTVDQGTRGGKIIPMKDIVNDALDQCKQVQTSGAPVPMLEGRDLWLNELMDNARPYCPCEWMDSEDVLFLLYTSGSTGKPKGLAHCTGGYLVYAYLTTRYIFDLHDGDAFGCMADIGWITGHTYVIYGPLVNGVTTFLFGSLPTYPDPGRYWRMVERYHLTQFYTAPTAIRTLMRFGDDHPKNYDLSSLRVLGSVGEPINPEAWRWYNDNVGQRRAAIIDTYWQTETGGIVVAPIPGAIPTKAGAATLPFFGIELALLDPTSGVELEGGSVQGLLMIKRPWPGQFRTVWRNHKRGIETYFGYKGYYLTGDAAYRDKDDYIWICGRIDDTINVSGHRIGSAEIEHALVQVPLVAEAAVVGFPHAIKGQGIFCFVTLKEAAAAKYPDYTYKDKLYPILRDSIRTIVGPFATPDVLCTSTFLPKTRSGKIMRRILRKLVNGANLDQLGDTSTLADSSILPNLVAIVNDALASCPFTRLP